MMTDHFDLPPERPSRLAWWLHRRAGGVSLLIRLPERPSRLLWWLHPKVALPLLLLTLLVLAPFLYRGYRIASVPDIGHPFDVEAFGTVDLDPADNAMTYYAAAARLLRTTTCSNDDLDQALDYGWEQASDPLRKWLDDNQLALAEWRKGTERSQAVVVQPKDLHVDTKLEIVQQMREFARLSRLQADRYLHEGDVEGAWDWLRASDRSGRHCAQNGCLIQQLVGIFCQHMAAGGIEHWAADARVSPDLLRRAQAEYLKNSELSPPNSVALKCEYLMLNTLRTNHPKELADFGIILWPAGTSPSLQRPALFLLGEPEYSRRVFQHVFQNWLSQIDLPRWQRAPMSPGMLALFDLPSAKVRSLPPKELEQRLMSLCMARFVLPAVAHCEQSVQRRAAREEAMKLMLACQLYHRQYGDWPVKLEDLIPDILSEIPADPLGKSGETLRLKRDGDELIIHSVGWNGTDDGGAIENKGSETLDEGFRLTRPK